MWLSGLLLRPKHRVNTFSVAVGHGFTNSVRKPFVGRLLRRLACRHPVVALDFRGHGRSAGRSTAGAVEWLDVAAAVRLARGAGDGRVATLGFSLGATVALLHGARTELAAVERPDAIVAVSPSARWWARDTVAMRRMHSLVERPAGRVALRALGVRVAWPLWPTVPPSPIELVGRIAPTPLLLVHGDEDHYLPAEHSLALHRAAGGGAELWLERGMRHAETAMTPALLDRIADWLAATVTGRTTNEQAAA